MTHQGPRIDSSTRFLVLAAVTLPHCANEKTGICLLDVERTPLSKGMDGYWTVGMALLQIFPNLKSIKYQQQLLFGMNDWGEVMRIIKVQRNITSLMTGTSNKFILVPVSDTEPV